MSMRPTLSTALVLLLLGASASAPHAALAAQTPGYRARLDSLFGVLERHHRTMGSVTIRRGDRVLYQRTMGYRDSSAAGWVRADQNTSYRLGSVAKPFTAVLIYQLIDEGRLSLATSIDRFFPSLPDAARITVRDLLGHTSGLTDYTNGIDVAVGLSRDSVLQRIASSPLRFAPGTRRQYSNSNFYLLGLIVEAITAGMYEDRLRTRITGPLGLRRTAVGRAVDAADNEARAYYFSEGHWERQPDDAIENAFGAGHLVSTTADLTAFLAALFTDRLISKPSLHEMTHGFVSGDDRNGKGMSPFSLGVAEREGFSHDGSIGAHTALIGYEPSDSIALALTINGHNYPINRVFFHTWKALYGAPDTLPSFVPRPLPDSVASAVAGDYHAPDWGISLSVRTRDGLVEAQSPGQSAFPLVYLGRRRFMNERDGILLEFSAAVSGRSPRVLLLQQKYQIPIDRRTAPETPPSTATSPAPTPHHPRAHPSADSSTPLPAAHPQSRVAPGTPAPPPRSVSP